MEKLKYLSFALFIALCAGFVSCSDDDEEGDVNGASIEGIWERIDDYDSAYGYRSIDVFESGGKYTWYYFRGNYADAEVSTWSLQGSTLCCYGDEYEQVKSLTNDKLVLIDLDDEDGEEEVYRRISREELESLLSQYEGKINYYYDD